MIFMDLESGTEYINNRFKKKVTLDIKDSRNYIISDMYFQNSQNLSVSKFKSHVRKII